MSKESVRRGGRHEGSLYPMEVFKRDRLSDLAFGTLSSFRALCFLPPFPLLPEF
jgi:hypothetical protein